MFTEILKAMFADMVEKKDASLIPHFYHPQFELYANGQKQDYAYFLAFHQQVYQTEIQYKVGYDESAFIEQGSKVASRVFFEITKPGEVKKDLEVILIAEFKDNKIYRVWELCYPDWTQMSEFETSQ